MRLLHASVILCMVVWLTASLAPEQRGFKPGDVAPAWAQHTSMRWAQVDPGIGASDYRNTERMAFRWEMVDLGYHLPLESQLTLTDSDILRLRQLYEEMVAVVPAGNTVLAAIDAIDPDSEQVAAGYPAGYWSGSFLHGLQATQPLKVNPQ